MGDPQSWNGYAYARNNPLLYSDPTGEFYNCNKDKDNCAELTNEQFDEFQNENKRSQIYIGNKIYARNEDGTQGALIGTFPYTGDEIRPEVAGALGEAARHAESEIIRLIKDATINAAGGAVLGTVVKVGLPAAQRLLPFKDARIIQRINNILDELASGVRNFDKAREFENRLGQLPAKGPGYYREFTVQPPLGVSGRGAERLVVGRGGEVYYTPNQYGSFARVQ